MTVASPTSAPKRWKPQRPVVEVGAQRGHDPQPAVRRRHRVRQTVEERPLLRLAGEREELLELVDDQQQLTAVGHEAAQRPVDPLLVGRRAHRPGPSAATTATRWRPSASSSNGDVPGTMAVTNHRSDPGPRPGGPAAAARPARRSTCRCPIRPPPGRAAPAVRRRRAGPGPRPRGRRGRRSRRRRTPRRRAGPCRDWAPAVSCPGSPANAATSAGTSSASGG